MCFRSRHLFSWIWSTLTIRTALSSSQSLNIISGDLPPSSRETFFKLLTAQLEEKRLEMTVLSVCLLLAFSCLFNLKLPLSMENILSLRSINKLTKRQNVTCRMVIPVEVGWRACGSSLWYSVCFVDTRNFL